MSNWSAEKGSLDWSDQERDKFEESWPDFHNPQDDEDALLDADWEAERSFRKDVGDSWDPSWDEEEC